MNLTIVREERHLMETKELILKNALDMFAKSGYDSVSIRDIACKVDIKESSIYYHFKNKQDILDSLVVRYEDYIKEFVKFTNQDVLFIYSTLIVNNSVTLKG